MLWHYIWKGVPVLVWKGSGTKRPQNAKMPMERALEWSRCQMCGPPIRSCGCFQVCLEDLPAGPKTSMSEEGKKWLQVREFPGQTQIVGPQQQLLCQSSPEEASTTMVLLPDSTAILGLLSPPLQAKNPHRSQRSPSQCLVKVCH